MEIHSKITGNRIILDLWMAAWMHNSIAIEVEVVNPNSLLLAIFGTYNHRFLTWNPIFDELLKNQWVFGGQPTSSSTTTPKKMWCGGTELKIHKKC